jgi:hypothetical protein
MQGKGLTTHQYNGIQQLSPDSPKTWATANQVKHLSWVQQLLKTPQKLDPLVVSGLGVDKHKQRGTILWSHWFPSFIIACKANANSMYQSSSNYVSQ